MSVKISRTDLIKKLNELGKETDVFCPAVSDNRIKIIHFNGNDIITDTLPFNSLKEFVLPQRETLIKFTRQENKGFKGEEVKNKDRETIVFSKPCDASAIVMLDKIFPVDKVDNYYKQRRENLIIVSMACQSPCKTCFCKMMQSGPFHEKGCDILSLEGKGDFYLKPITEKGEKLIKKISGAEIPDDIFNKEKEKAESLMNMKPVDTKELKEKTYKKFEHTLWKELGIQCLGCGVCTYLCPTCHCFDIDEEVKGDMGIRVRNWDSCQFALFTLHASGHNPRPSQKERMRQRFQHKLSYIPENNNLLGCVGCGRCVISCPVNIDIRDVINKMLEQENG